MSKELKNATNINPKKLKLVVYEKWLEKDLFKPSGDKTRNPIPRLLFLLPKCDR